MYESSITYISFINGLVIAYICLCRLGVSHEKVLHSVRLKYTLLLAGALAFGAQPILFQTYPTGASTFFMLCITVGLLSGFDRWKSGPPEDTLMNCSN